MKIEEKSLKTLQGHTQQVLETIFLSDGTLASCSKDRKIKIWNLDKAQQICELNGHNNFVYSICLLSSNLLASGSEIRQSKFGTGKKEA